MGKSGKGVKVELYDIINHDIFDAERKKCSYHHEYHAHDDEIGEDHCTRNYKEEYIEGKGHKHCADCSPIDCVIPSILKNSMRNSADICQYMLGTRAVGVMDREKRVNEAVKVINKASEENAKALGELGDILECKFDYSDPEVKKILKLMK